MERSKHQCKLCTRSFSNGRALGGHMKAHLATLPLPPKPAHHDSRSSSFSSFSSEEEEEEEEEEQQEIEISSSKNRGFVVEVLQEKSTYLGYGLRENPKKSFRLADPEFFFAINSAAPGSVVLDRESETESRNPTRKRSKRSRTAQKHQNFDRVLKKAKIFNDVDRSLEPVLSSVSDTSPEEDVAMCLMMLSRDAWVRKSNNNIIDEDEETGGNDCKRSVVDDDDVKVSKIRGGKFRCEKCMKLFRSSRALIGHKRICSLNAAEVRSSSINGGGDEKERIFECPYCFKVFGSGQALGGHKRSHLLGSSAGNVNGSSAASTVPAAVAAKSCANLIDLNLPAPVEDDEFSVVSDA